MPAWIWILGAVVVVIPVYRFVLRRMQGAFLPETPALAIAIQRPPVAPEMPGADTPSDEESGMQREPIGAVDDLDCSPAPSVALEIEPAPPEAERIETLADRLAAALATGMTLNCEVERTCMQDGRYPSQWPRHLCCPVCGTGELAFGFEKFGFRHERCVSCGFVALNPYPPEDVLHALYAGPYYTNSRELYELPRMRTEGSATPYTAPPALIDAMIDQAAEAPAGAWLDVGGGIGTAAARVRERRPGWTVVLNEFNPRSIEVAKEFFGLDATSDDAARLAAKGRRFDVVSSVSVLEHIPDPLTFVSDYAALLEPGGMMVLLVPHFTELNATVSKAAAPVVTPPFHVSLFRADHLADLLKRTGKFASVEVTQHGDAAFSLIHHHDIHAYWDILTPTPEHPVAVGAMLKPYPDGLAHSLNSLHASQILTETFFAESDGRQYLLASARKAPIS